MTAVPGPRCGRGCAGCNGRYPNEQFAFMAQRVVERGSSTSRASGRADRRAPGRVRRRRRVEHQGHAADPPAAGVEDVYVFPHMGDGGLAVGAAVCAAQSERAASRSTCRRLDLGPSFPRRRMERVRCAGWLPIRECRDLPSAVADLIADGESCCGFRAAWNTGPARSATAACSRGPIGRDSAIASIWSSSAGSGISRSARACSRATRRGCCRLEGLAATAHMTMAYLVSAGLPRTPGRGHQHRRVVPPADVPRGRR